MRQVLDGEPATAQIPRIPADGPIPAPAVREVPEIPEPVTTEPEVTRSERVQSERVQSDAVQSDAVEPAPVEVTPEAAAPADDPFSSLPRLTPFTDLPLEEPEAPDAAAAEPSAAGQSESTRGRHEVPADDVDPDVSESRRRHRRAAEQGDDVLARLLAREAARR
jgi:hypothetical protein